MRALAIGMLVMASLLASCAAEPEERTPTPPLGIATIFAVEPVGQRGCDADVSGGDDQAVLETETSTPSIAATSPDQATSKPTTPTAPLPEPDDGIPVVDSGDATVVEPTGTDPQRPEIPEPGGSWVDQRQPDFTKTVPPPRR